MNINEKSTDELMWNMQQLAKQKAETEQQMAVIAKEISDRADRFGKGEHPLANVEKAVITQEP